MFELLLQADQALEQGRFDDAKRLYEQVLDLDSTNAIAVAGLARIAFESGDDENAGILAQRALAIDPESVVAAQVEARRRPVDPFAMAEAAAAIEAIDAFDALDAGAEGDAAEVAQPATGPAIESAGGGETLVVPAPSDPAVTVPDAGAAERGVESALEEALAELLSNDTVWEVASSTHSRAPLARAGHGRPPAVDAGGPRVVGQDTPTTPTNGVAPIEPAPAAGEQPNAKRGLPTDFRDSAPDETPRDQKEAEPETTQKESSARPRQKGLFGRFGGR